MALLGGSSPSRRGCRPGSGLVNAAPPLPRCVGRHPPLSTFARWVLKRMSFSIPAAPLSSTLHPVPVLRASGRPRCGESSRRTGTCSSAPTSSTFAWCHSSVGCSVSSRLLRPGSDLKHWKHVQKRPCRPHQALTCVPEVLALAVIPDLSPVRGEVHGALVCVRGDVSLVEFCRFQDPLGTTSDWDPCLRQGLTWLHRAANNSRALWCRWSLNCTLDLS